MKIRFVEKRLIDAILNGFWRWNHYFESKLCFRANKLKVSKKVDYLDEKTKKMSIIKLVWIIINSKLLYNFQSISIKSFKFSL